MEGMLSQDEINALLSGMDLSDNSATQDSAAEDIVPEASTPAGFGEIENSIKTDDVLTEVERDAIGEVANISMGSSATTLYSLVNRKVNITTPRVEIATWENLLIEYEKPCVFIQIKYTEGLDGTNILVLREHDVKVITDLMMGGDGTNTDSDLGELHLSAISEAMNQMMGSAATSLSTMLKTTIDISPPDSSLLDLTQVRNGADIASFLGGIFVKISFRMQIDKLVDSTIMQLYPVEFARKLVETFIGTQVGDAAAVHSNEGKPAGGAEAYGQAGEAAQGMQMGMTPQADAGSQMGMPMMGMPPQMDMGTMGMPYQMDMNMMGMNPRMNMSMMGMNPQMNGMGMMPQSNSMGMMGMPQQMGMSNINVQPAQFQSFSGDGRGIQGQENINLIMDVPLEVTVELGRTSKSISEILNFAPGTIIELERIAGEPIDVLVNGKLVAKGEVVVIEESFGVRVTEIIK